MVNIRLSILGIIAFILLGTLDIKAQTKGFFDDFEDGQLSCNWNNDPIYHGTYTLSEHDGKLDVDVNQTTNLPTFFWIDFGQIVDISSNSAAQLSFVVYSDSSFSVIGGIGNNSGFSDPTINLNLITPFSPPSLGVSYSQSVLFQINYGNDNLQGINKIYTTKAFISIKGNGNKPFKGKIFIDNLQLGQSTNTSILNGGINSCTITGIVDSESVLNSKPLAIYNLFGQEVLEANAHNGVYIYHFADGSKNKIVR